MKRLCRLASTALFCGATLISSGGCSRGGRVPVLRGSELVFRARRDAGDPLLLRVELVPGQEAADVHAEGWYVSVAQMSRLFELLGEDTSAP